MTTRRRFLEGTVSVVSSLAGLHAVADETPAGTLRERAIPATGEMLPVIGLGNAEVFAKADLVRSAELIDMLLAAGGRYVDTSGVSRFTVAEIEREQGYGDRLFVGTYIDVLDEAAARQEAAAVSAAQGGGPLDLVLTRNVFEFDTHRGIFDGLKSDGIARYVGVARHQRQYHAEMMRLISEGAVDFVQVNYSMLEPEAGERLLPMAADNGVAVLVNRPFVNGDYFRLVQGQPLPEWAAEFDCDSWARFSLKYILSNPAVTCVLTETSNPQHAADNLGAGTGALPDPDMRRRMRTYIEDLA